MPPRQPQNPGSTPAGASASLPSKGRTCKALTTAGQPCKRPVVPGLTVCKSHGGGTAASVRAGKRASVSQQVSVLWGVNTDASGISVEEELTKLARAKMTDVLALRIKLSEDDQKAHIGLLSDGYERTESEVADDVYVTIKKKKSSGVSPWVAELHKAEAELVAMLRLLHEISGGSDDSDVRRIRLQTARETARLLKAFPGLGVDEVAAEITKRAS